MILAFTYVDRLALGLVLQQIKVQFSVSDTELGILTGIAFALFYSVMGIPIARWADKGDRRLIISITTLAWAFSVSLCGLVSNAIQLLLARILVAVGEAGSIPTSLSLISDHFDRAHRPRAVGIYMMGGPLSVLIGYFLAGWLDQLYGWKTMFEVLAAPGVILSGAAWYTLREPRKQRCAENTDSANTSSGIQGMGHVFRSLCGNHTFRHLLMGISVTYFFGVGLGAWLPTFFIRSYGLSAGEVGTSLGLIFGVIGMAGTFFGGHLASRRAAKDERRQLIGMSLAYCLYGLVFSGVYITHNIYAALGLLGVGTLGSYATLGPLFATIQTLVPERMRATAMALVYLFANLIGMGLGPVAVGALSDTLRPMLGQDSLRYSLMVMSPGYLWAAWHLRQASSSVLPDLRSCET